MFIDVNDHLGVPAGLPVFVYKKIYKLHCLLQNPSKLLDKLHRQGVHAMLHYSDDCKFILVNGILNNIIYITPLHFIAAIFIKIKSA